MGLECNIANHIGMSEKRKTHSVRLSFQFKKYVTCMLKLTKMTVYREQVFNTANVTVSSRGTE